MLYHNEIYMPSEIKAGAAKLMSKAYRARFSRHLKDWLSGNNDESTLRKYKHRCSEGDIKAALLRISRVKPEPFEVEVDDNGQVLKYAVRQPLDSDNDITVVVDVNGVVRTAWVNSNEDIHRTLNPANYVSPEK